MSLADREHLPKVVTDVDGIRDILLALDPEIVLLREDISQLIKELYIATTEKYIDRWEQDFSLPYDSSLTLEQRRQRVKNKLARKKVLNWQNLRLLIKNNIVKPRFYIVNEAENYHFKIFLEQQPQRQEFDLSKFTVVGSPTITEYGVASGFVNNTNYSLDVPTFNVNTSNNWKIIIEFEYDDRNKDFSSILATQTGYSLYLCYLSNEFQFNLSSNNSSWNIVRRIVSKPNGTISGDKLRAEINYNNNTYTISILNLRTNITQKETITSSEKIQFLPNRIGNVRQNGNFGMQYGSIDLKQFSITVDGKEVFSGIKNIDYITNELRTSLNQAKPAYLTYDIIVTEFFTRYCGTFSSGTEPL